VDTLVKGGVETQLKFGKSPIINNEGRNSNFKIESEGIFSYITFYYSFLVINPKEVGNTNRNSMLLSSFIYLLSFHTLSFIYLILTFRKEDCK
jgi:hypothetical protein